MIRRFLPLLLGLHLFAVGLLPGADTRELADASALWQHHGTDHQAEGFWDFFFDHYLGEDHQHPDATDHQSLPLHHGHDTPTATLYCLPITDKWQPTTPSMYAGAPPQSPSAPCQPPASGVVRSCWQPPRV